MKMLEVHNVCKSFNKKVILDDISFHIQDGEIVGLIGKNGAGKSTLMKIIADVMRSDAGEVLFYKRNIREHRVDCLKKMSVLIEGPSLYGNLRVLEHLKLNANLRNIEDALLQEAIAYLNFDTHLKKKISKLSLGMKQEVALAICFMNDPDFYLLDEPINGLDFDNVMKFRNKILDEKSKGKSILISSHILRELEVVADRYLFLDQGKLVEVDKADAVNIEKTYEEIIHG